MQQNIVKTTVIFMIILPILVFCQTKEAETIRLYYLGGQSNMDGYGKNPELPKSLTKEFNNVWIFHGNPMTDDSENGGLGIWEKLKPGHGSRFSSDGNKNNLSDRFGVELSFAQRLRELYPDEKIAIIKYSRGGTSIDTLAASNSGCWDPDYMGTKGLNQYDHFLATIRNALSKKNKDWNNVRLIPCGIVWMQGESDAAYTEEIAGRYYSNFKRLMDLIRAALHVDDLPVVLGKISDSWNVEDGKVWDYGELVQHAQEKYARTDGNAAIIRETRYYKYSDPWHYDSTGYIDLGKKFADAIFQLNTN